MAIIETETVLLGKSRIISITLRNDAGVEQAASSFRALRRRPDGVETTTELTVLSGTTSTYEFSMNFTIAGEWYVRMESDNPDDAWEKLFRVMPSAFSTAA